jgi:hypothetical protein
MSEIAIPKELLQKIHPGYGYDPEYPDGYSKCLRHEIRKWFLANGYPLPEATNVRNPTIIIDDAAILIEFKLTWM